MKYSTSTHRYSLPTATLARALLALLLFGAFLPCVQAQGKGKRAPQLPATLQVPAGHKLHARAYAEGVQIYVWTVNPTNAALSSWVFREPEAILYADAGGHGEIGIHYAGPTWESNSGSKVVGARVAGSTVDPTAIPWLLLQTTTAKGPGIFARTTYIQRVNTVGGLAPATPGTSAGQEARVPYTAVYFFFRGKH